MATEQTRCCEWGDCDAEATVTIGYPARVPGKPHARCTVDWEDHRYCEECAVFAGAEVNEIIRKHREDGCTYCEEEIGDDEVEEADRGGTL